MKTKCIDLSSLPPTASRYFPSFAVVIHCAFRPDFVHRQTRFAAMSASTNTNLVTDTPRWPASGWIIRRQAHFDSLCIGWLARESGLGQKVGTPPPKITMMEDGAADSFEFRNGQQVTRFKGWLLRKETTPFSKGGRRLRLFWFDYDNGVSRRR